MPAKKPKTFTQEDLERAAESITDYPENCSTAYAEGLSNGTPVGALRALRYVANGVNVIDEATYQELRNNMQAGDPEAGIVLAWANQSEKALATNLKEAGFTAIATFKNPSTGNTVTLFGAPTGKEVTKIYQVK
jgi:hypothetical protein